MDKEIKKHLLELAEDVTEDCVEKIFLILEYYIMTSKNKVDDMILPFLGNAKEFVLKYVNKIDGQD